MKMSTSRPYILRALNDWILDNGLTPYLLVNAEFPGVEVPQEYVNDGQIILNITPGIVSQLFIENDALSFDARFSGVLKHIFIPMSAIAAIYAKENGRGMVFSEEDIDGGDGDTSPPKKSTPQKGKPTLRIVK